MPFFVTVTKRRKTSQKASAFESHKVHETGLATKSRDLKEARNLLIFCGLFLYSVTTVAAAPNFPVFHSFCGMRRDFANEEG